VIGGDVRRAAGGDAHQLPNGILVAQRTDGHDLAQPDLVAARVNLQVGWSWIPSASRASLGS